MPRKESRKQKLNWVVKVISVAVVILLVLISARQKSGGGFGLPELFDPDFLHTLLEDIPEYGRPAPHGGEEIRVHFIDVGQGKSILIEAPEKNVLIDAGENDQGQKVLNYLSSHKIEKLDIVIGTHPHSDHIGGLDTVIEGMTVEKIIMPVVPEELTPTNRTYTDLLRAIASKGLKITPAKPGGAYELGGGARLTILGPVRDYDNLNDESIVSRLDYGDTPFIFTGDALATAERDLTESEQNLKAAVLDISHHGSTTSNTHNFLKAVNPRVAVISCGVDNSYGHPHRPVMERLRERDIEIYRTDTDGAVVVVSDGEKLEVKKEK